jgi:hypothetical protein
MPTNTMNFKFSQNHIRIVVPRYKTSFRVYLDNETFLGFVFGPKELTKKWAAGIRGVNRNLILKHGFTTKKLAAEYLYNMAVFNRL